MRARKAFVVLLVLAVSGCSNKHSVDVLTSGFVVAASLPQARPVKVAYGKYWPLGGVVETSSDGRFSVPKQAHAVVAFVDNNHNGTMERYSEPSADCEYATNGWRCELLAQKTTLQRSVSTRMLATSDQTFVFWEDYDASGRAVPATQLCADERCTSSQKSPFVT